MKYHLVILVFSLLSLTCLAQSGNTEANKKVDELISYLRSTSFKNMSKEKAGEFTFKFYDMVMFKYFNTAEMMKNFSQDKQKFAPEGRVNLQRLF